MGETKIFMKLRELLLYAVTTEMSQNTLYCFVLDRQPHGVECQSLCGSEVT